MIQLEFFDTSGELFLCYQFDGERPSPTCYVSLRDQGIPSKHSCTVTVDGSEVVTNKRGFRLTTHGRQSNRDLPIQKTRTHNPLSGLTIDAEQTESTLPKHCWKQYGRVRIQFERSEVFYEVRDNMWDGTVNIYKPVRVVLELK